MEERTNIVGPPQMEDLGINPGQYLALILKRKWLILAITAIAPIIAAIYCLRQTPLYQARTSLYIDRADYSFVPDVVSKDSWHGADSFLNTQFKILKSKNLATRIVEALNLKPEDLSNQDSKGKHVRPTKSRQEEISALASHILGFVKIEPIKETSLCEVVVTTPVPKLSMTLSNAWAEEYVEYSLAAQYENTQKAQEVLDEQIKSVREGITATEKKLRDYSRERGVVKLDKGVSMTNQRLEELNISLTEATRDRISKAVHYNDLKNQNPESSPEVTNSTSVQQLRSEYARLEQQYTEKAKTYKLDYPEMSRIRSQMDLLKKNIDLEIRRVFQHTVSAAQAAYNEAAGKERALKSQLESTKQETVDQHHKELNYDDLVLEIDQKKELLQSLLQKRNEAGVSEPIKDMKATMIRIVDRAELPNGKHSPRTIRTVLIALILGLGVSIGLALSLEFLDRSLKTTEEVERFTQLPTLGLVPLHSQNGDHANRASKSLVKPEGILPSRYPMDLLLLYAADSVTSEAIRTVRTSLLLSFPERAPHTILITSSKPGEGKTFISCNLALSLAQLNKKVLLIDADMRNPRLHRIWGIKNENGLSRLLTSDEKVENVMVKSPVENVMIIPSGIRTPRPAELLASPKFEQLLQTLTQSFDHVILDSPPLLPVADSMIVAGKCDCVVMVIHGGETSRDIVQKATQHLSKTEAVVAGAVLNCVDLTNPYYYYTYYSSYRYYYGDRKALPEAQV
jgi:succinoglycan biosynthesis transport protein ExoP